VQIVDFPIAAVRAQFPALSGNDVFLDNPGGTQVARGSARIGLAHYNTTAEVTGVLQAIEDLIQVA
jgi:selenocysteine lyase/cysteine desulfurase